MFAVIKGFKVSFNYNLFSSGSVFRELGMRLSINLIFFSNGNKLKRKFFSFILLDEAPGCNKASLNSSLFNKGFFFT